MSDSQDGHLVWPPTKQDLERLYLDQKLSAAKIATAYGLKYKNAKVAESTILHQLKKNGIKRRDKADHIKKVNEGLVNEWVRRFKAGESLKQIAKSEFSPVTVFLHLRKRGLQLRDKVEAQIQAVTKHQRILFEGDENERAYVVGFTKGDYEVIRHGRAIRVRTSTTHPAMADLFTELFDKYGYVHRYPRKATLVGYEWSLEVDLNQSFKFLFQSFETAVEEFGRSPVTFLSFLAGFFDAEGSIYYHRKGKGGGFELSLSNTNDVILERIRNFLLKLGYYSKLDTFDQNSDRLGYSLNGRISRLVIWRAEDILGLLGRLRVRHNEKVVRAEAAIAYHSSASKDERVLILTKHEAMKSKTKAEVVRFVDLAMRAWSTRNREVTGVNG